MGQPSGDWLIIQQETLSEHGEEGWELVSVVLLETEAVHPKGKRPYLAHAVAMYFKRPLAIEEGE